MNNMYLKKLLPFLPYLFFLVYPLLLFSNVIFFRNHSFFVLPDMTEYSYPSFQKLARSLHSGYLPLWDANKFSGTSFVGEIQTGVFYPLSLLVLGLFGTATGVDIIYLELLILIHFFIASLGMYLLCREWKLSRLASLGAGLVFAYAGPVVSRPAGQSCIFFGLSLMPLAIYFLVKFTHSRHYRYLSFSGIILGLQILAGHFQPFFHTSMIAGLYLLALAWKEPNTYLTWLRNISIRFTLTFGTAIIIALPQLLLGLQALNNSYRWVIAEAPVGPNEPNPYGLFARYFNIEPYLFLLNPIDVAKHPISDGNNIFIGLIPLCLLIFFFSRPQFRQESSLYQQHKVVFLILSIFTLLVTLGYYTFFDFLFYQIPLVDKVREAYRYVIILHFVLAALVGFSLHSLQHSSFKLKLTTSRRRLLILGLPLLISEIAYLWGMDLVSSTFVYESGLVFVFITLMLILQRRKTQLTLITVLLIAAGTFLHLGYLIPDTKSIYYSPVYYARNSIIDYLEPYYGKYRIALTDKVPANISDITLADKVIPPNIGDVYNLQTKYGAISAVTYKPLYDFIFKSNADKAQIDDLLNVKFIISKEALDLKLVMEDQPTGLKLYERANYYPRVFFRSQLGLPGREIEALKQFDLLQYQDNYQKYLIRTTKPEEVIFSEIFYPGWQAYVDNNKVNTTLAQIAGFEPLFKSINLTQGEHVVEFKYLAFP